MNGRRLVFMKDDFGVRIFWFFFFHTQGRRLKCCKSKVCICFDLGYCTMDRNFFSRRKQSSRNRKCRFLPLNSSFKLLYRINDCIHIVSSFKNIVIKRYSFIFCLKNLWERFVRRILILEDAFFFFSEHYSIINLLPMNSISVSHDTKEK